MKVMLKPKIIDAEIYQPGLEDGFLYGMFDHEDGFCSMACDDSNASEIPFIYENEEYIFIEDGDYIITDVNGNRFVVTPDEFERMYDVCSTCDPVRVQTHEQTIDTLIQRLDNVENRLHKLAAMAHDAWSSLDV